MASNVKYTGPSKSAIAAILNKPEIKAALLAEAERGKAFAEADAATYSNTGDYASKFDVDEGRIVTNGIERPTGILRNTSDHAAAVEWGKHGSAHDPGSKPHHTLARTAEFLGGSGVE